MWRRLAGVIALATVLAGCTGTGTSTDPGTSTTSRASSTSGESTSAGRTGGHRGTSGLDRRLVADLEKVEQAHPDAEVAVALAPVGGEEKPRVVGTAPWLIAWSTIKVPLSLAVIRSGASGDAGIEAAITASDNESAMRLWEGLGSGEQAADAVRAELRRGGDARTRVPPWITVPGYSPFGQATWRLTDQATFTAALPCLSGSSTVTDAMGRVVEGQRWGLGRIEGARFKGGWGSTPDGYVVRQLGLLPGTKGETAATVQVRTGTHEQGTAIASELADVLERHRDDLPTGSCG